MFVELLTMSDNINEESAPKPSITASKVDVIDLQTPAAAPRDLRRMLWPKMQGSRQQRKRMVNSLCRGGYPAVSKWLGSQLKIEFQAVVLQRKKPEAATSAPRVLDFKVEDPVEVPFPASE